MMNIILKVLEDFMNEYPSCEKAPQAQYKLDLIERRAREEKLLYLLKVIGEENLSTREEYERQLRVYALEDETGIKHSLLEAQARIAELEDLLSGKTLEGTENVEEPKETEIVKVEEAVSKPKTPVTHIIQSVNEPSLRVKQNKSGQGKSASVKNTNEASKEAEIQALKRKAKQLQYLLEEQKEEGEK